MGDYGRSVLSVAFGAATPTPVSFELRPLSIGEILDRTFVLYRQRFWLYCGLAAFAGAVATLGTFARLSFGLTTTTLQTTDAARALLVSAGISVAAGLIYFMAFSVIQAATVSAVSAAYLSQATSLRAALEAVKPHWLRYIAIALWQAWSAMWLTLLFFVPAITLLALPRLNLRWLGGTLMVLVLLSLIYSPIAYIRNSLGVVASVRERLKVRAAMRRSKQLVAGHKGRVFALLLLLYVLNLVAGVLQGVFAFLFALSHTLLARIALESTTLLMTFVTSSLVAPVGAIAFCLIYIDERVRKEGYDIEVLMERAGSSRVEGQAAEPEFDGASAER